MASASTRRYRVASAFYITLIVVCWVDVFLLFALDTPGALARAGVAMAVISCVIAILGGCGTTLFAVEVYESRRLAYTVLALALAPCVSALTVLIYLWLS